MTTQKLTRHQIDALKKIKAGRGSFRACWSVKSWPVLVDLGLAKPRYDGPRYRIEITQAGIDWLRANQ